MGTPETKPFASLTGSLLARKGAARPAMRSHVSLDWAGIEPDAAIVPDAEPALPLAEVVALEEAGEDDSRPEVLRQIAQLSAVLDRKVAANRRAALDVEQLPGKKVAFTLRLDPRRHALLRACCTAERRSAQSLLIEALDRLVDATPGLEDVLAQLPQSEPLPSTRAAPLRRPR
ncbi:hypothetical protein IP65_17090 [Novosphingobium sp. AAP1]|uniref:hypothetical protein n=1 Tax=Novosphingobium sp. AAP1 TaxID=1523413 RepID=UPI0006B93094|nr:hypothetical protein [Novosphingobium sp. AAP1]KPF52273.1 hypothetical protein IP65_17090 [Novosphingobium sp. AAP1]